MWIKDNDELDFIGGGLRESEADQLRNLVKMVERPGMIGFEIGCYTGWTASQVLPTFKENHGRYFLIDWFRGNVDTSVGPFCWSKGDFDSPRVLTALLKNMELQQFHEVATVAVGQGEDVAPFIKDGIADYIYIGADHRYSHIKRDIQTWLPKLRDNGIICGHGYVSGPLTTMSMEDATWLGLCQQPERDYHAEHCLHFGIVRALRELLPGWQGTELLWWYILDREKK